MIKYALRCAKDHTFDSWFQDAGSFDTLARAGHLACPSCHSTDVSKALMAPAVVTSRKRGITLPPGQPTGDAPTQPIALTDEKATALRAMLRDMRDHVVAHSKDVGVKFADEARRMHDGVSEEAAIRGVASPDEVRALLEDGIEVAPLPVFPDDRN